MVAKLKAKPGGDNVAVKIGDFATTTVEGSFGLVYLICNTIMNLTTHEAQVACFRNAAAHLRSITIGHEVIVPVTGKDILYAGAGTDDPRDENLLPGTGRSKNSFIWFSYFHKITSDVTLAGEWSLWDFQTRTFASNGTLGPRGTSGRGNVVNIALAYQF